jgi:hypothetical protein
VPKGPNPKATWDAGEPPPCADEPPPPPNCTYTQCYWGNKPDVVWPDPYSREALFYELINDPDQTWQGVLDTSVAGGNGYYQLSHQYIAAVLNVANGVTAPEGILETLEFADNWLGGNTSADCGGKLCGEQKTWATTLALFNEGKYPGGPKHGGDEVVD